MAEQALELTGIAFRQTAIVGDVEHDEGTLRRRLAGFSDHRRGDAGERGEEHHRRQRSARHRERREGETRRGPDSGVFHVSGRTRRMLEQPAL